MIRRLLIIVAFAGMVGSFALSVRDIYRLADWYCGLAEAGGNCRGFAAYFAKSDIEAFAVFAVALAVLLLLQALRPTGK